MADTVETPVERELYSRIMRGGRKPRIRKVRAGRVLVREGEPGKEVFLLLEGELSIDVGGKVLAQLGPGHVVGERAVLETGLASTTVPVTVLVLPGPAYVVGERQELKAGRRTSTLTAVTNCRLAVVAPEDIEPEILKQLAEHHRHEDE